jgi:hypothetical protein
VARLTLQTDKCLRGKRRYRRGLANQVKIKIVPPPDREALEKAGAKPLEQGKADLRLLSAEPRIAVHRFALLKWKDTLLCSQL